MTRAKRVKDELTVLFFYSWFGVIIAVTVFAAVQPSFGHKETLVSNSGAVSDLRAVTVTPIERHCIIATAIAEATPMAKVETIEIMRNILRRREMGTWGPTACSVVTAPRQFSAWNNRMLPGVPARPGAQYRLYSEWLDEALRLGPNRWSHYYHGKAMWILYGKTAPKWAASCVETALIGDATFCRFDAIPDGAK